MQTKQIENISNQFPNAETLWFWFISSRRLQTGFRCGGGGHQSRPCEMIDIETMITRLYLSGELSPDHLRVIKEYGDKRRAPNQHVWRENRDAAHWRDAMKIIGRAAATKGWIEK